MIEDLPDCAIFIPIAGEANSAVQVYQRYVNHNWKLAEYNGLRYRVGDPDQLPLGQLVQVLELPTTPYWYDDEMEDDYGDRYLIKYPSSKSKNLG